MTIGFTVPNLNRKVLPDKTLTMESEPRVRVAQFGDGYAQRVADGINAVNETFEVSFVNRPQSEADDITSFFETNKAVTSFKFTIPNSNSTSTSTAVVSPAVTSSTSMALVSSTSLLDITVGAVVSSTGGGNNIVGAPTVISISGTSLVLSTAQTLSGSKTLTFASPNEKTVKVVCVTWNMMFSNSNHYNINAQFKRVYEP